MRWPWTPGHLDQDNYLETAVVPQEMQFMIDLLPTIRDLTAEWPATLPMDVIDVGVAAGAGTNLLATLHSGDFFRFPMRVTAVDHTDRWLAYVRTHYPLLTYRTAALADLPPESWDLVISSHVIEHVPDPLVWARGLQAIARRWVVVYAPYDETPLMDGHAHQITASLVQSMEPLATTVIRSPAWYKLGQTADCIIAVLPGLAR